MDITRLDETSVVTKGEQYGTRCYMNSEDGRSRLAAECPPEVVQMVMEVWGDAPRVSYPEMELAEPEQGMNNPRDLVLAQLMRDVAFLKAGADHV